MPLVSLHAASQAASSLQGGRAYQQDAFATASATADPDNSFVTATVCDGHGSGTGSGPIAEAAAALITQAIANHGYEHVKLAYQDAKDEITRTFPARGSRDNTCSVTVVALPDGTVLCVWVGDCRAYLLTAGNRLIQLTTDHNRADQGYSHIVTRALLDAPGAPADFSTKPAFDAYEPELREDHSQAALPRRILLTTDGVHDVLTDTQIRRKLIAAPDAQSAADRLTGHAVRTAWSRHRQDQKRPVFNQMFVPTPDNATALVIDLPAA